MLLLALLPILVELNLSVDFIKQVDLEFADLINIEL